MPKLYSLLHTCSDDSLRDTIWNLPQLFRTVEAAKKAVEDEHAKIMSLRDDEPQTTPKKVEWEESGTPEHWYAELDEGSWVVIQPVTVCG